MKKFIALMLTAVISITLFGAIQNNTPVNAEPAESQTDGLIGWWKFNDTPDSISDDSSASNNGGTNQNMSVDSFVADVPNVCSESNSYAVSLNPEGQGDAQRVVVGNHVELRPTSITVAAWIKPNAGNWFGQIAGAAGFTKGVIGYALSYSAEYDILEFFSLSGNTSFTIPVEEDIEGQWTHVAATYDETTGDVKLYLNGNNVNTYDGEPEPLDHDLDGFDNSPYSFEIGRAQNTEEADNGYFEGLIDDVRVYDFALNDSEIESLSTDGDCGSSLEDLNGDEVPDSEQPNVGGYVSSITGKTIAIDVGSDCELTTDDTTRESSLSAQDPAYEYANGLWEWEADCVASPTTVRLYYYDVAPGGLVARKFNTITKTYSNVPGATITTETINGSSVTIVTYQIADNGPLDLNPDVGSIADPVGLGAVAGATGLLSETGTSALLIVSIAMAVLAAGAGIVMFSKRRRAQA